MPDKNKKAPFQGHKGADSNAELTLETIFRHQLQTSGRTITAIKHFTAMTAQLYAILNAWGGAPNVVDVVATILFVGGVGEAGASLDRIAKISFYTTGHQIDGTRSDVVTGTQHNAGALDSVDILGIFVHVRGRVGGYVDIAANAVSVHNAGPDRQCVGQGVGTFQVHTPTKRRLLVAGGFVVVFKLPQHYRGSYP